MSSYLPPIGTSDIFPEEISRWNCVQTTAEKVFLLYGYGEIRTPIFEYSEVFKKSMGTETEIVQKEMYSFEDRGGRELTLRPEGTAGVMRALMKTEAPNGVETRVFYFGPMFRGERPAAGRKRQFHQVGVENVGKISPEHDAECIAMAMHYLNELKIIGSRLLVNTRGTLEDRGTAKKVLKEYFSKHISCVCKNCEERLSKNVWRILDCKAEQCQEVIKNSPDTRSLFTKETQNYFDKVVNTLNFIGISFEIDPRLVRGLDYYQHTVFEVTHKGLGGQNSTLGGGRYVIKIPGSSKSLIGVGFAAGVERLLMAQDVSNVVLPIKKQDYIFLVSLGNNAKLQNLKLISEMRRKNIPVLMEFEDKSMKAQMRSADRFAVSKVLIRGNDELSKGIFILKDMQTGAQSEIKESEIFSKF